MTYPCQTSDPPLWTSEDHADLRTAAEACAPCPIIVACREAALARRETAGVWGGVVFETTRDGLRCRARACDLGADGFGVYEGRWGPLLTLMCDDHIANPPLPAAKGATDDVCANGHDWVAHNIRYIPSGGRRCIQCARDSNQRVRDRKKAAAA